MSRRETNEQMALRVYERDIKPQHEMRQNNYYMEKNQELQRKKDELVERIQELEHTLEEERQEVLKNEHYKVESEQKDNKINELEALIAKADRDKHAMEKLHKLQMEQMEAEKNAKIEALNEELATLNTFRARKAEIEREEKRMKRQLQEEREAHEAEITKLDREFAQEKRRVRESMKEKLKETQDNLLKLTDKALDTTTKRTILENVKLGVELGFQSKESEKLMSQNKLLKKKLHEHRLQEELLEEEKVQLAKKHISSQKVVKMLMARVKELEDMLEKSVSKDNAHALVQQKNEQVAAREQDITNLLNERENMLDDLEGMQQEIGHLQEEQQEMLGVLNEAAGFIVSLLNQAQNGAAGPNSLNSLSMMPMMSNLSLANASKLSEVSVEGAEEMTPLERERALRQILAKLNFFQGDDDTNGTQAALEEQVRLHQSAAVHESDTPYSEASVDSESMHGEHSEDMYKSQHRRRVETTDTGVQTDSVAKLLLGKPSSLAATIGSAQSLTTSTSSADASAAALNAMPSRSWGKKASSMKLSKHSPQVFLTKRR